jgi:hypothetical protein
MHFRQTWRSMTFGLLEYRKGNHAQAIDSCRRCLAAPAEVLPRTVTARLILAMALREAGQEESALSELELARNILNSGFDAGLKNPGWEHGLWFDWVFARVLLREASELLRTKRGSAPPSVP